MNITDLHLCENPPKTNSTNSQCECPPEYYCTEICGEEYSISTYVSWQHFPRSTSSRSRCDDSSQRLPKSISDTPVSVKTPEKEESLQLSTTQYPIQKSFAQLNAQHYLDIRHVFELLNFMIGHLVCNEPDDPVQFLEDLLSQCLKFRDSFGEPPLLFTNAHIKSLYSAFDPFDRGYLTPEQYREALDTLGLKNGVIQYNEEPPLNDDGNVEDSFFMFEAERCLLENLKQMLRVPLLREENRLKWESNMAQREVNRKMESTMKFLEENTTRNALEEKNQTTFCDCYGPRLNTNLICKCPRPVSLRLEPEQMFYDNKTSKKIEPLER